MIIATGVFADAEEREELRRLSRQLREMPLVHVTEQYARNLDQLEADFKTKLDELAVKHGLPVPGLLDGEPNHYGMLGTGEFTRYEPDSVEA